MQHIARMAPGSDVRHALVMPEAQLMPWQELDALSRDAWADLAAYASEPNAFLAPWFLAPSLAQFCTNPDLRVFLLWAGRAGSSQLAGLLPIGAQSKFGRWPVPHIQNWMHHNMFLGTPLVRPGYEAIFWEQLLAMLDDSDWPGFLHLNGLTVGGPVEAALNQICESQRRACELVHIEARAMISSQASADRYFEAAIRGKKRKELRRQAKRLSEIGVVTQARHRDDNELGTWISEFLALEQSGWKGKGGSALACDPATRDFFGEVVQGAATAGALERLDLRLDGKPLAMLVNFLTPPGSFSFKTTFDENFARFSPGVLLQLDNDVALSGGAVKWMDSCAASGHPMIDSLWTERRHIGRFSVALSGVARRQVFRAVRFGERAMDRIKHRQIAAPPA
ncbi:MAG: GNAT family N-acetyltransferase [Parasphingorhabdus sp.]|nr:GNAT family N-acetyltransferase [Parasphingorhabdus sp.]